MDIHAYQFKMIISLILIGGALWVAENITVILGIDYAWIHWAVAIALLFFALWLILPLRDEIFKVERRQVTGWTFLLWIIFAVVLIKWRLMEKDILGTGDLFFLAFTILLADSYWDFKDNPRLHKRK